MAGTIISAGDGGPSKNVSSGASMAADLSAEPEMPAGVSKSTAGLEAPASSLPLPPSSSAISSNRSPFRLAGRIDATLLPYPVLLLLPLVVVLLLLLPLTAVRATHDRAPGVKARETCARWKGRTG